MRPQELDLDFALPIATGRTAEIYSFGPDKIIKLFNKNWPRELVEHEAKVSRLVQTAGLPTPAVGELIEISGRTGLVYQRVNGITLLDKIKQEPWKVQTILAKTAKLQSDIHHHTISELPLTVDRLANNIKIAKQLTEGHRERAIELLRSLPSGNNLNHGDFHVGNIMDDGKRLVIIDWDDVSIGNRLADISRTVLLLSIVNLPPGSNEFVRRAIEIGRNLLNPNQIYLSEYAKQYPFNFEEYEKWFVVNAAARLSEEVPGETDRLLKIVTDYLGK